MSPHDVLVAARNLLDTGGWIQHEWETDDGRCALGAISGALGHNSSGFVAARDALERANGLPSGGEAVIEFNNAPERTKADVLAAFDRAIAATAPAPDTSFLNDRIAERDQNAVFFGPMFEEAKS